MPYYQMALSIKQGCLGVELDGIESHPIWKRKSHVELKYVGMLANIKAIEFHKTTKHDLTTSWQC